MKTSFYEYGINLEFYQIRGSYPDIVEYSWRYRESFLTCLKKCGNQELSQIKHRKLQATTNIMLLRPKTHVRGWMLMTSGGIIESYGTVRRLNYMFNQCFQKLTYSCLNKAVELNLPMVKLRTPIGDPYFNIFMESFLQEIGCELQVRAKYY